MTLHDCIYAAHRSAVLRLKSLGFCVSTSIVDCSPEPATPQRASEKNSSAKSTQQSNRTGTEQASSKECSSNSPAGEKIRTKVCMNCSHALNCGSSKQESGDEVLDNSHELTCSMYESKTTPCHVGADCVVSIRTSSECFLRDRLSTGVVHYLAQLGLMSCHTHTTRRRRSSCRTRCDKHKRNGANNGTCTDVRRTQTRDNRMRELSPVRSTRYELIATLPRPARPSTVSTGTCDTGKDINCLNSDSSYMESSSNDCNRCHINCSPVHTNCVECTTAAVTGATRHRSDGTTVEDLDHVAIASLTLPSLSGIKELSENEVAVVLSLARYPPVPHAPSLALSDPKRSSGGIATNHKSECVQCVSRCSTDVLVSPTAPSCGLSRMTLTRADGNKPNSLTWYDHDENDPVHARVFVIQSCDDSKQRCACDVYAIYTPTKCDLTRYSSVSAHRSTQLLPHVKLAFCPSLSVSYRSTTCEDESKQTAHTKSLDTANASHRCHTAAAGAQRSSRLSDYSLSAHESLTTSSFSVWGRVRVRRAIKENGKTRNSDSHIVYDPSKKLSIHSRHNDQRCSTAEKNDGVADGCIEHVHSEQSASSNADTIDSNTRNDGDAAAFDNKSHAYGSKGAFYKMPSNKADEEQYGNDGEELFFIANSIDDYLRLGAAFAWVYGWQLCYASSGAAKTSLPWLQLINRSAVRAATRLRAYVRASTRKSTRSGMQTTSTISTTLP